MFPKKSKEKIKKMDVLITSVVLGTIIAGAFGLKKRHDQQESTSPQKRSLLRKVFDILLGK
ncbi:hypothetical protein KA057_00695 [Candidatus Gracilibacteria bacterium]|nr:hypothetical protein [Candidatus Gracilibacteria bacterium]